MKKIFVVTEEKAGERLLSAVKKMTEGKEYFVAAVSFGDEEAPLFFRAGAGRIYSFCREMDDASKAMALKGLFEREKPEIVLFPSTVSLRTVAPMTAAMLSTGLTCDCTELFLQGDGLLRQTRPAFGGSLSAEILCEFARPQMATVQEAAFLPACGEYPERGEIVYEDFMGREMIRVLKSLPREAEKGALADAKVVVAGGLGVGSSEGFMILRELAGLIPNAVLGASRGAVSANFAAYECQVGLTGAFVRPEIYLAFGISGAVQHLAGMKNAKVIVAVNTDKKAPIFDYADVAICAPWEETAKSLIAMLSAKTL